MGDGRVQGDRQTDGGGRGEEKLKFKNGSCISPACLPWANLWFRSGFGACPGPLPACGVHVLVTRTKGELSGAQLSRKG